MDWKTFLFEWLQRVMTRKFFLTCVYIVLCVLNYTEIQGIGKFGMPVTTLALVALVVLMFLWMEGQADIEERKS